MKILTILNGSWKGVVDLNGGQVEVVRRLSDASVATRDKHAWAYAHTVCVSRRRRGSIPTQYVLT